MKNSFKKNSHDGGRSFIARIVRVTKNMALSHEVIELTDVWKVNVLSYNVVWVVLVTKVWSMRTGAGKRDS